MSRTSFRLVLRCAIALSGLAVVTGCTTGLPQLRPGSNITLPRTTESNVVRALFLPCQQAEDVTNRAGAVVECDRSLLGPQRVGPAPKTP